MALLLAISTAACLRPASKQRGYVASTAAVIGGTVLAFDAHQRECNGSNIGDNIGCGISKQGEMALGITTIVLGTIGLGITAAMSEPAKP